MPRNHSSRRRCAANGRLAVLNVYSVRIMLGLAISLGVLVLCFRLAPLRNAPRGVGWIARADSSPLTLHDVREARDGPKPQAARNTPATSFGAVNGKAPGERATERSAGGPSRKGNASGSSSNDAASQEASQEQKTRPAHRSEPALLYTLDRKPRVVGGLGGMYLRIGYPRAARRDSIEGRLLLRFVVEKDGSTSHVRVTRSLHPLCDSAAVRAVEHTRFVPGRRNGKVVRVRMQLPVRFKLVSPDSRLVDPDSTLHADRSAPSGAVR